MTLSSSSEVGNAFYQKVGCLFYSIAMADQSVHIRELDALKKIVRDQWLSLDDTEDEFGSDSAFQIEIVFDWLLEYEKEGPSCFEKFEDFYHEHYSIFSPKVKELILKTAHAIANAFSGKNKSELVLLGKLELLLKKDK
ncbi:hypothetical protein [Allomuricauda sp. SCSIO 65647]|uniref:hypothetical protein n=1 Tax=Allomuricauda sp. SCSIO 65647 TaxID=2908843 RepID=UPI001F3871EB|nr:hypothetical protein [Muricauda sp. SCSIO 65647]UJH67980.1 hypothetical protein L0P89_01900 [Muricauda sp. SCSIO 65647]